MKTILVQAVFGLSLFASFSIAEAAPDPRLPLPDASARQAVLAALDEIVLSDKLQRQLATLSPNAPVAVIVTFTGPGNAASVQRAVGSFQVRREYRIINGFAATMTASQAKALARVPGVFRIEEDFKVTTMLNAADVDFGTADTRSDFAVTGAGVGICIVDTGADPGHEQLNGGKIAEFVDYINGRTAAYDDHGHGTHVAAIAAGDGTGGANAATFGGVAPGATVFAAKVLDSAGSGDASGVIAGVEWCADPARNSTGPGVQIISMSLGTADSSDGRDALSQAVNNAVAAGKIAVVAAGNSGDGPETIGSPGAAAQAITVGAVAEWSAPPTAPNHSDGAFLASFSSRGPTADGRSKPDISAPGVSITSAQAGTASGYVTWSGTSMATPFVAGTVALALENEIGLGPTDVKNALLSTAQDRGPAGIDNDWGAGLVDGYTFLASTRDIVTEPTPFPAWHRQTGTVANGGVWTGDIEVTDTTLPVAVTLTIDGQAECSYWLLPGWCLAYEWSPDLDTELIAPDGTTVLGSSTCPLGSECGSMGRQETLHILPAAAGTYQVRVYPYGGSPNNGKGGSFALDVSTGPLTGAVSPPEPLPAAGVQSLLTGYYEISGKGRNKVTTFREDNLFFAGEEIVLRARVLDDSGTPIPNAVVTLEITGPEFKTLNTSPSSSDGWAEARWQTTAPSTRGKNVVLGTATGSYAPMVDGLSAAGYNWNGEPTKTEFQIE